MNDGDLRAVLGDITTVLERLCRRTGHERPSERDKDREFLDAIRATIENGPLLPASGSAPAAPTPWVCNKHQASGSHGYCSKCRDEASVDVPADDGWYIPCREKRHEACPQGHIDGYADCECPCHIGWDIGHRSGYEVGLYEASTGSAPAACVGPEDYCVVHIGPKRTVCPGPPEARPDAESDYDHHASGAECEGCNALWSHAYANGKKDAAKDDLDKLARALRATARRRTRGGQEYCWCPLPPGPEGPHQFACQDAHAALSAVSQERDE